MEWSRKESVSFVRRAIEAYKIKLICSYSLQETYIPTLWQEPVSKRIKKFPVVVFSHGYGATRFLCSTVCNELASRGYIVAALEHK